MPPKSTPGALLGEGEMTEDEAFFSWGLGGRNFDFCKRSINEPECDRSSSEPLRQYGNTVVPFVLTGLGVFIVLDSHSLTPQALVISCLCLMGIVKNYEDSSEVVKN
jgi:hypothetical protein